MWFFFSVRLTSNAPVIGINYLIKRLIKFIEKNNHEDALFYSFTINIECHKAMASPEKFGTFAKEFLIRTIFRATMGFDMDKNLVYKQKSFTNDFFLHEGNFLLIENIYRIGGEKRDEFADSEEGCYVFINLQEVRNIKQGGIQPGFWKN